MLRHVPVVLIGRAVRTAARLRKAGGGSAVPGLVVNRLAPGFLGSVLSSFPQGLVVVSGSAGKSTTTKMLVAVLEAHGLRVFTNPSTANISQGLTSALLECASLTGRIAADIAVLEMDEGHGALLSDRFTARIAVLTNVMTDQVDRFHDAVQVQTMLGRIAATATDGLVLNADDGLLAQIGAAGQVPVHRFGASAAVRGQAANGLGYAETIAGADAEVLVDAVDGRCASLRIRTGAGTGTADVALPARGVHYAVDAAAALASAAALLGGRFAVATGVAAVSAMTPVFGRGEVATVRGQPVEFVLVQNTASLQLNVAELDPDLEQVLVAMGSDVRDPSYFWPADVSRIGRALVVSGSKAEEFALQLIYQGVQVVQIDPDLTGALDRFLALPPPTRGVKTIVFTADAMRRTRSHLGLAS